jgi:hypothetical protein
MTFKPLTLEDQPIFQAAEVVAPSGIADTMFTNLFIWRSYYRPFWRESHGCLCLLAAPQGEEPFGLPPVGGGNQLAALDFTAETLKALTSRPVIKRVPEGLAQKIKETGRPYSCLSDRDNDDYVYLAEQLRTLGGRRLHQKKNHYNFFVSHNQFECLPVTRELAPELLAVQESWLATKEERETVPDHHLLYEVEAVHELIKQFDSLNQLGLAIRIDGRIAGFTMGEIMSPDTVLVHIEKADYEIRGLFVALSSHFCRQLPPDIVYVNREQDLGLPGLRQSKESLKPDHMRRKYILTLENG